MVTTNCQLNEVPITRRAVRCGAIVLQSCLLPRQTGKEHVCVPQMAGASSLTMQYPSVETHSDCVHFSGNCSRLSTPVASLDQNAIGSRHLSLQQLVERHHGQRVGAASSLI